MKMKSKRFLTFFCVCLVVLALTGSVTSRLYLKNEINPDTIFINGTIIQMNPSNSTAEALAVKGDKIVAVGTNQSIQDLIGDNTRIVDLDGKTLLPGFYDTHSHFPSSGTVALFRVDCNSPPMGTMNEIGDIIVALKKRVQETAEGEWIRGRGYDDTLLKEKRHPTRHDLDKASTEHPIWIVHTSGHLGVANSRALELGSVNKDTPQPEGGSNPKR
ncbi:unnamed protein product, partial [marine sediment metagenome]